MNTPTHSQKHLTDEGGGHARDTCGSCRALLLQDSIRAERTYLPPPLVSPAVVGGL
jgi:hypothetical protein